MLYVSDFFTRYKEAVSNQLELLSLHKSGKIIAATRFMNQKALLKNELKDGIVVVPPYLYPAMLAVMLFSSRRPVHSFEEESFAWKKILLNASRRPLYVSLYRRPDIAHISHLRGYKHLKKIFVELPVHKELLISHGFEPSTIAVTNTPSKVLRKKSKKAFNPKDINVVFASWNNSEPNALHDRGLLYLLDLLVKNPEFSLTIPLRDKKTEEFLQIAQQKGVINRVHLIEIENSAQLEAMFHAADFVAFVAQSRVVKDVPNSLIDGLAYGKPVFISDTLDFWTIIQENHLGYVVKTGTQPKRLKITEEEYGAMSKRAYAYSKRHTPEVYRVAATAYEEAL